MGENETGTDRPGPVVAGFNGSERVTDWSPVEASGRYALRGETTVTVTAVECWCRGERIWRYPVPEPQMLTGTDVLSSRFVLT